MSTTNFEGTESAVEVPGTPVQATSAQPPPAPARITRSFQPPMDRPPPRRTLIQDQEDAAHAEQVRKEARSVKVLGQGLSKELQRILKDMHQTIQEQTNVIQGLTLKLQGMEGTISLLREESQEKADIQASSIGELQTIIKNTLPLFPPTISSARTTQASGASSPGTSYASVLGNAPAMYRSGPPSFTPAPRRDIRCTIDTTRAEHARTPGQIRAAIEETYTTLLSEENWKCMALMTDPREPRRIRVICRSAKEQEDLKKAIEKILQPGERLMRDQLYPVKIDSARRDFILDEFNQVRPEAAEILSKENNVQIAKVNWLSNKDSHKAYGSFVAYLTTSEHAATILEYQWLNVGGESAKANRFKRTNSEPICYNCQEIGHRAFNCKGDQRCAKCAELGHSHHTCESVVPKCCLCKGPHQTYSRGCPNRNHSLRND